MSAIDTKCAFCGQPMHGSNFPRVTDWRGRHFHGTCYQRARASGQWTFKTLSEVVAEVRK